MLSPAQILATLGIELLGIVPDDEGILVSNSRGTPIAHDQRSLAGRAYHNIARRLLGERVAFIPLLECRQSLLERLGFGGRRRSS